MNVAVLGVPGIPEITTGDDLGTVIRTAVEAAELRVQPGDILVVASKIVAKSLGLRRYAARDLVIAEETRRVVAERATGERVTRVVESAAGPVMAAAGVDESNLGPDGGVLLLPRNPDAAAAAVLASLRAALGHASDEPLGVIISDTAGRPWRGGIVDFALGSAGVHAYDDHRGGSDTDGRPLLVTTIAVADEIAAAADLVKGKVAGAPVAIVRGLPWATTDPDVPGAAAIVRTGPGDWFRSGHVEAVRAALGVIPGSPLSEQVGIRALQPESPQLRAERAVRLAVAPLDTFSDTGIASVGAWVRWPVAELAGDDDFTLGRVLTRLEVAAVSEDLAVTGVEHRGSRVTVTLADHPASTP